MAEPQLAGSSIAASDLYGDGVRIGMYLQVLGMLFCCVRHKCTGIKFASSTTSLALLGVFTNLAREHENISPVEAWIILSIISIVWFPAISVIFSPNAIVGEGIATTALALATVWQPISSLHFWGFQFKELQPLNTKDLAFCFVKVRIHGWFQKVMFCVSFVQFGWSLASVIGWVVEVLSAAACWLEGQKEFDLEKFDRTPALSRECVDYCQQKVRKIAALGLCWWVISIISIEKMIGWNDLSPVKDLKLPGQAIPLGIGIMVFLDGFIGLFQPSRSTGASFALSKNTSRRNTITRQ